jgi:lipopolysaccharide transport system ATP-binding protein
MSSEMAISIKNISKRYEMYAKPRDRLLQLLSFGRHQYFKEFWALNDISFDVSKGEAVGILGRNGSGKSTLLQIIAGTLAPTFGEVQTIGVTAALLELGSGFNSDFTGRENVYLNGSILGFTQEEMDARFDAIASFADIGEHLDQPVKTYSSGMYVRLAFAVQACVDPQILIVDEALSVGDEKFQRKSFEYIERLRSNGCSVLLVTHSTATVEKFCQRGILLHSGAIHGIGPAKKIVDQYHALLYSDEKAYLRYLNKQVKEGNSAQLVKLIRSTSALDKIIPTSTNHSVTDGLRAIIKQWEVVDPEGSCSEIFMTGDSATIRFYIDVLSTVNEIQAGILIRTVEGVSAFGTSSVYHGQNYLNAKKGTSLVFDFDLRLDLCPGNYFVTLAIAEAISHGDMSYLDRKTDVIVLKIDQARVMGSGIAALKSNVSVTQVV